MSANLYVVGYMGAGKSTVGAAAAKLLGRGFIDLDQVIETREGCGIPDIFARQGEAGFRVCEQEALRAVAESGAVVATGGGILTWPGTREAMENSGVIVFLDRPLESILADLDTSARPMAAGGRERITSLYRRREEQYRTAAYCVPNIGTLEEAAAAVASLAREVLAW